jgi:hypothetical protein
MKYDIFSSDFISFSETFTHTFSIGIILRNYDIAKQLEKALNDKITVEETFPGMMPTLESKKMNISIQMKANSLYWWGGGRLLSIAVMSEDENFKLQIPNEVREYLKL